MENDHICLDVYIDPALDPVRGQAHCAPAMSAISPTIPRAALVTGGAQRIGRTIALALAGAGFDVALHCHTSLGAAEATGAEIARLGRRAVVLPADLSDETQTRTLLPRAAAELGPIGVLVNNASP